MRPNPRAFVSAVALALAACSRGAPPAPNEPQAATPPAPAVASAPSAPTDDTALDRAIRIALGDDWEAHHFDATTDLNGDGRPEKLVYVAGPMVCGTGGCPLYVFTEGLGGYRLASSISVSRPPIRLSPRSSQGWRNLVVATGGGGTAAGNAELRYDGARYATNPTVPPAEPLTDVTGTEVLIPEFESYKEGRPVPDSVYGDPSSPVGGEVFRMPVHTQDAEELRYVVLGLLTDRYATEKGIAVTPEETAAYIAAVKATLAKDPNVSAAAAEESAEDAAAREQIAAAFIRQWKLNRALYQQYGGRILFQQGGPEPLDAYRKFLEESASRGDFRIVDKDLEAAFWRYYRDDSIHSFYEPGSPEEARAFADPPWLAK